MVTPDRALKGRAQKMPVSQKHYIFKDNNMEGPYPEGLKKCIFADGCFVCARSNPPSPFAIVETLRFCSRAVGQREGHLATAGRWNLHDSSWL